MTISGATGGYERRINGVYVAQGTLNKHALFVREDDDEIWLRYDRNFRWNVGSSRSKELNNSSGIALSSEKDLSDPSGTHLWKIKTGKRQWQDQVSRFTG